MKTLAALMLLALACVGSLFYAGYSTLNFLIADTSEEAIAQGRYLPEGWEAGVWSHGQYIQWYTLQESPFRFALALLAPILLFWVTGMWIQRVFFPRR